MQHRVAILPWGNLIEHYLDPIGLDLQTFATEMSGGWLFGYTEALRAQSIDSVIVCTSRAVLRPKKLVNAVTGVTTIALPPPRSFQLAASSIGDSDLRPGTGPKALLQEFAGRLSLDTAVLTQVLRDERCTMLLCQEYEHPRFATASAAARRAGVASFAVFQGGVPSLSTWVRQLRQRAAETADGLIIASSEEEERVQSTYQMPKEAVLRAPNPLSLDVWFPEDQSEARHRLGLPTGAFVVVCHGRIEWHRKGVDVLLAGWRRFASDHPGRDLQLRIIGSGADDSRLEAELRTDPVPGLSWTRAFSNDRAAMRQELSAADVYVLSSRHEGFPVAPLEAMACGLPLVLSDAPGTADILLDGERSGGLRISQGDAEALACALGRLLLDEEGRVRMGRAALMRVRDYASVPAVGMKLGDFMRRRSARIAR